MKNRKYFFSKYFRGDFYYSFLFSLFFFIIMTVSYLISYVTRRAALCCGDFAPYCCRPARNGRREAVWAQSLQRKAARVTNNKLTILIHPS